MIVVADSCACGIAAIPGLLHAMPGETVRYLADYAINPLGQKSDAAILQVVRRWNVFAAQSPGAHALVLACNTASAVAARSGVSSSGPLTTITMIDAFESMMQQVPLGGARVLILGTRATIDSAVHAERLQRMGARKVRGFAATRCEAVVAGGRYRSIEGQAEAGAELAPLADDAWDAVILGCSCFGYLRGLLRGLFGAGVPLLDPLDYLGGVLVARSGPRPSPVYPASIELATSGDDRSGAFLSSLARETLPGAQLRRIALPALPEIAGAKPVDQ